MKVSKNSLKEVKGYNPPSLKVNEVFKPKILENKPEIEEEYFDVFFHHTPIGLAIINDSLRYERVNETLAGYNGLKMEEHLGKSIYDVNPALAPKLEIIIQKILRTGEPVINAEISGETKGFPGQTHYWLASYMPLNDVNGSSSAVGAIVFDITEHKHLETRRERDALKNQLPSEQADAVLILNNPKGNFLYASPQVESLLGYKSEEILDLNVRALFPVINNKPSFSIGNYGEWQAYSLTQRNGELIDVEIYSVQISAEQTQIIIRNKRLSKQASASVLAFPEKSTALVAAENRDEVHAESIGKLQLLKDVAAAISVAAEILEEREQENLGLKPVEKIDFYEQVSQFETRLITQAMAQTHGNQKRAAELLGIKNTTLNQMLKRYNMLPDMRKKA